MPVLLIWCLVRQPIGVTISERMTQRDLYTQLVASQHAPGVAFTQRPDAPAQLVVTAAGRSPTLRSVFVIEATITPAWARYAPETLQGAGSTARMAIEQLEQRIAE